MTKTKWDGAKDGGFFKIVIAENFEYALQSSYQPKPTAVFPINRRRQKYSLNVL